MSRASPLRPKYTDRQTSGRDGGSRGHGAVSIVYWKGSGNRDNDPTGLSRQENSLLITQQSREFQARPRRNNRADGSRMLRLRMRVHARLPTTQLTFFLHPTSCSPQRCCFRRGAVTALPCGWGAPLQLLAVDRDDDGDACHFFVVGAGAGGGGNEEARRGGSRRRDVFHGETWLMPLPFCCHSAAADAATSYWLC